MKLTCAATLASLFIAAQADSWFIPSRNATCSGAASGDITCEQGHVGDAPEWTGPPASLAIRGREANPLERRLTCNIDGVTQGLSCYTHCFALGYCNSHCDDENICRCNCMDETPWYKVVPCIKTSCA